MTATSSSLQPPAPSLGIVECSRCRKPAQVPTAFMGRKVRCPACQFAFIATPNTRIPSSPDSRNCPSCRTPISGNANSCSECGWLDAGPELLNGEARPLVCTNPACGVANSTDDRYCQRCNSLLPSAPGTLLHGRYRVEKLLAIGGFGAVYKAFDVQAHRTVALKDMISAESEEMKIRLSFFRREAQILKILASSPIVPRIYDYIEDGPNAHLVMEFIKGRDLLQVMEANGSRPFPIDNVVEWGKEVCGVLHAMHRLRPPVVHRDLKPDNLMLLEDGRSIKMIDFGTARGMAVKNQKRAHATRVFTEGYAPPEQIVGNPEIRSDLFALAGTLYHLTTGAAPEGYYTARELDDQLASGNGAISSENRWLYELIKINLSEDVNERYFSALEIRGDMEKRRLTKQVTCPGCKHTNAIREPYCLECAQPLTLPAPPCRQCSKDNPMGSKFCIHCGHRLR